VQEEANPMTLAEMMRLLLFYVEEELAEDFTEVPTHSLTGLLTYSLTHWLTYSLAHWLTHLFTGLLTHSLTHSQDSPLQIPHLKGDFSEALLITVYQCYCNEKTGFMALEEFIDFMEDRYSLSHSVTHSPTHLLTYSLTHLLTYSLTHALTYSLT
jgi:hypothetical protein